MADGDLTTLDNVKAWLPDMAAVTASDDLLAQLITAASRFVCNATGRASFAVQTFSELYDGGGHSFMLLRQWPVVDVQSIAFEGTTVTQAATGDPPSDGYLLEPPLPAGGAQRLSLTRRRFPCGRSNVTVVYDAGYAATPPDIEQAVIELVGERFRTRDRIGQTAKTLGDQETTAFSTADMNPTIKALIAPYRRLVPC